MQLESYDLPFLKAIRYYAEGMAHLGNGNQEMAKQELIVLKELSTDTRLKEVTIWDINTVYDLVQIASKVLEAEVWASEGEFETSIVLLKEGIAIEDVLNYNEPPDWFFSVRHHLGEVQLKAEKYHDAIITYEEDLKRLPKNGWAHIGLKHAYTKLNDLENIARIDNLLKESWATADVTLE